MSAPVTGAEIAKLMARGASKGLAEAALAVLEAAKHEVPVATEEELQRRGREASDKEAPHPGQLRDSGHIRVLPGGRVVEVIFDEVYAARVHEDLRAKHPHGGGPKYLEKPLLAMIPKLEGIVAAEVHKRLAK